MTPLGLLVWSLAAGVALLVIAVFVALAILLVRAALHAERRRDATGR